MNAPSIQVAPGAQSIPELTLEQHIERTVIHGDLARFRELVFVDYGAKVLTDQSVAIFTQGFRFGQIGCIVMHQSFVGLCMTHGRPEFVREVMECARELSKRLPGDEASVYKDWFRMLCSASQGGEPEMRSPPDDVAHRPRGDLRDYREFILMTLEYLPKDEALYQARTSSDEARAFITECEMELRIRQVKAATPLNETISPPARRLRCL